MLLDAPDEAEIWRKGAASVLMGMMFLPLPGELQAIDRFEHDVNMGKQRVTRLYDKKVAGRGLRQRALFHMNGAERMYRPAEIEGQGMTTRLSLLAHSRFGLPLQLSGFIDA